MYVVPPLMMSFEDGTKSGVVVLKPFFTLRPNQPRNQTVPSSTCSVASFSCAFDALSVGSTVIAPTKKEPGVPSPLVIGSIDQSPPPKTSLPSATVSLVKPWRGVSPLSYCWNGWK